MFPDHNWDWYSWRYFKSWISEILDRVVYICSLLILQDNKGTIVAATTRDELRPNEKPRPPRGGHYIFSFQTRISSDTGGF